MKLCDHKQCTVCGACVSACPKQCITYQENKHGFSYPYINKASCVSCGKCTSICHVLNDTDKKYPYKAYAAWSNDAEDRKTSTSGGAASVFYKQVLSSGGYCFGATYDENLNVVMRGYNDSRIVEFKNSKYVHSDMHAAYKDIKDLLSMNESVIFIGLPCQVAALKSFLKKDYENLITVDLICHGTPPNKYLYEHIEMINSMSKKKVTSIKFRNDNEFCFMAFHNNKKIFSKDKEIDTYLLSFFDALTYHEACYECKYANPYRVSDITIGDFWGLGLDVPFNHPYTGAISLVLINTDKGEVFFRKTQNQMFTELRTVDEAMRGNDQLNRPSVKHRAREAFLKSYEENGFENAVETIYGEHIKKYKGVVLKKQINTMLRSAAKRLLRR